MTATPTTSSSIDTADILARARRILFGIRGEEAKQLNHHAVFSIGPGRHGDDGEEFAQDVRRRCRRGVALDDAIRRELLKPEIKPETSP